MHCKDPLFSRTKFIVADLVSKNTEYDSIILSDGNIDWLSCISGRRIAWSKRYRAEHTDIVSDSKEWKEDSDVIFNSTDIDIILPKLQKYNVSHILTRLNNPLFFNSTYFSIKGRKEGYTLFEVLYP